MPTSSKIATVAFQSSVAITGVTASSILASPTAQAAIISAATVPVNGQTPDVSISSVTDLSTQQTLVHVAAVTGVNVQLSVLFEVPYTDSAATDVYGGFTETVKKNVQDGSFTKSLQSNGGVLQSATATTTSFGQYSVTTKDRIAPPTSHPTASSKTAKKSTSAPLINIGLIVGVIVAGLALVAILIYLYYTRKPAAAVAKDAKVVPSSNAFLDLETVNAADGKVRRRPADAQPKGFNVHNIHYDETIEPAAAMPELPNFDGLNSSPAAFGLNSNQDDSAKSPVEEMMMAMTYPRTKSSQKKKYEVSKGEEES